MVMKCFTWCLAGRLSSPQLELEDVPEAVLQEGVVIGSGGDGGTC